jgi:error-prone DNA polymerase
MSCLPRLRPQRFYDIVVQVAIIRPGPIVGNMVNPYLERRLGRAPVKYAHPDLEPVLKRTLGVPLFQEQLLKMAMTCADFSGGEAEELRRAMGFKRSEQRMKEIEKKLRRGMTRKGISGQVQEEIVEQIASFALYGFPESHAASFALIAYASAYLKCHYLAAFTAATLNNQPMGFYQPFTIIKDAQRHGLKVLPVDVTRSNWECTMGGGSGQEEDTETRRKGDAESGSGQWSVVGGQEKTARTFRSGQVKNSPDDRPPTTDHRPLTTAHSLRLGLLCVKGLREEAGRAIVRARAERSFSSLDDLHRRVPELRRDELRKLAAVGALNSIADCGLPIADSKSLPATPPTAIHHHELFFIGNPQSTVRNPQSIHRRDALWQVERVARAPGPLYEKLEEATTSPLQPMTLNERLNADLRGTGITIGRHPMAHQRAALDTMKVTPAGDLKQMRNGMWVKVAGWVIVRQRPGTAKGFVFLSMEDETGIANVIVTPQLFETNRLALVNFPFLLIEGVLQHQDNVVSVKARRIQPLEMKVESPGSHDFH